MAKVFRIHKEGSGNIIDWAKSHSYGDNVIKQITDPFGAKATKEITSIPSPFSRVDLAVTAFKTVNEVGLVGTSIYHKIVSDCLDIGEIFFNAENFKDPRDHSKNKIEILVWDRAQEIEKLKKSPVKEHQIVGETLDMYLNQDAKAYNFDKMDKVYLLNYKGPDRKDPQINIIGATSPATLFFSSANDLTYVSDHLRFRNNDRPFDSQYTPLYERDIEFQRFLYAFRLSIGKTQFASLFGDFDTYMDQSYGFLSEEYKAKIDALNEESVEDYEVLTDGGSNRVDILGYPVRKRNETGVIDSDFEILATNRSAIKPLVLPVEPGNKYKNLNYVQGKWEETYKAPMHDSADLASRQLPYVGLKYPYLTIDDFLARDMVFLPYTFNSNDFYNGNRDPRKSNNTFLLPLTKTFFRYFTVSDLMGTMQDGKNMFEIQPLQGGSVNVELRIPIKKGGYILYSRMYVPGKTIDLTDNSGCITEKQFGLGVMPLVKFGEGILPSYRIAMFSKSARTELEFANGESICEIEHHIIRREAGQNACSVESYVMEHNFDVVYATVDGLTNVIIPRFRKASGGSQFTFAIDFGTTNSHIEYSVDGSAPKAFDMPAAETQLCRLSTDYDEQEAIDISVAFDEAFIPSTIGENSDYHFPMRTVYAEWTDVNYQQHTETLAEGNIPFRYEKARNPLYNKVKTNLKWSSAEEANTRVKLYIENLFIMMRNKVLLSGGRLSDTKVIWFYPASMTEFRLNAFRGVWEKLFAKYINANSADKLLCLSESAAPYFFYKNRMGLTSNAVTIDVGGGTTDVLVIKDDVPVAMTSFRFASNAIFGDGYNWSPETNGFVKKYKGDINDRLVGNSMHLKDTLNAFQEIMNCDNSSDIAAFFFSLAGNAAVVRNRIPLDFMGMLCNDPKMKYVFIVFYGSVIYHIAKLIKAKNLPIPQVVAFSGNGSKTLNVLSPNEQTISVFVTRIFRKVLGECPDIRVIKVDEPKLATSKGGIYYDNSLSYEAIESLRFSLLGADDTTSTEGKKYNEVNNDKAIEAVSKNVSKFIDELFHISDANKFMVGSLGADPSLFEQIPELCKYNLVEFTRQGLKAKLNELSDWGQDPSAPIEETMFFYPIVAMLNNLAREISNK
ncbi:MAG TPA: hypothetical protein PLW42_11450 [Anaerohalosphaeraceae bacterium]|nr:hypothetical protein [Anaerohalosphaeraceae bacterium]HQK34256.1 hypothetical protein [Spirochaetales bacterium]